MTASRPEPPAVPVRQGLRERATLGRTGLKVSRLGLASGYGISSKAVERAYGEFGVNYFYWGSRRTAAMADALRRLSRFDREGLVIALQTYDHLGLFMSLSVERGLKALGIGYADVLILGWFNRRPAGRVLDAALDLQRRGLVRFLALSGHNRKLFGELAGDPSSPFDVFMLRYSAAHRGAEAEIFPRLPAAREDSPGITVYTATRWGRLLDPRKVPPGNRPLTAAECYRFVLSHPRVDLSMTGPRTEEEMEEGLRALEQGPLTAEELERARRIGDHVRGRGRRS